MLSVPDIVSKVLVLMSSPLGVVTLTTMFPAVILLDEQVSRWVTGSQLSSPSLLLPCLPLPLRAKKHQGCKPAYPARQQSQRVMSK